MFLRYSEFLLQVVDFNISTCILCPFVGDTFKVLNDFDIRTIRVSWLLSGIVFIILCLIFLATKVQF